MEGGRQGGGDETKEERRRGLWCARGGFALEAQAHFPDPRTQRHRKQAWYRLLVCVRVMDGKVEVATKLRPKKRAGYHLAMHDERTHGRLALLLPLPTPPPPPLPVPLPPPPPRRPGHVVVVVVEGMGEYRHRPSKECEPKRKKKNKNWSVGRAVVFNHERKAKQWRGGYVWPQPLDIYTKPTPTHPPSPSPQPQARPCSPLGPVRRISQAQ